MHTRIVSISYVLAPKSSTCSAPFTLHACHTHERQCNVYATSAVNLASTHSRANLLPSSLRGSAMTKTASHTMSAVEYVISGNVALTLYGAAGSSVHLCHPLRIIREAPSRSLTTDPSHINSSCALGHLQYRQYTACTYRHISSEYASCCGPKSSPSALLSFMCMSSRQVTRL